MRIPSKQSLLKELDSLGHSARVARLARLGRDAKGTPELGQLLQELVAGDPFEASLGLQAAAAARDEAVLLKGLEHPSIRVRLSAAGRVARWVSDETAIESHLEDAPPAVRRRLLDGIKRSGQTSLAERLLPRLIERWGVREAAVLLPACGPELVRARLPELAYAVCAWRRLALRHPGPVLEELRGALERSAPRDRSAVWARLEPAIDGLGDAHAAALMKLAAELSPPEGLPRCIERRLGRWSRKAPEEVFALLVHEEARVRLARRGLPATLARHVRRLRQEGLEQLARLLAGEPERLAELLSGVAPGARAALFAQACAVHPLGEQLLPDALLERLPHALRDEQAARMAAMREIRESPAREVAVVAFRDIDAARERLVQACSVSKAEERAFALAQLVRCTGRSRRGMTETLTFLARLKNEQDPVRLAAVEALGAVPPSCFEDEHAEALLRMTRWITEARDTSHVTRGALQTLAFRLMQRHAANPECALFQLSLSILQRLAKQSGTLSLPPLAASLPRGAERQILAVLQPMIRDANARESHQLVLALAAALGKRAWHLDLLQKLLEPVTEASPEWLARRAIALWLESPESRDRRVMRLLEREPSAIVLPEVFDHLHRRRQEWLDPYLEGRPLRGKFLTGKTVFVLPAAAGFERWLPRQQRALARMHGQIASDQKRSDWERAASLRVLSRMPVVDDELLCGFLSDETPVVEAALGALAWIDRPEQGLPVLLQHLDGDRARVAMYAVPRCARHVAPSCLGERLGELLDSEQLKVTVHKEALRLLGVFRPPGALELLEREWKREGLHRDVRIAAGHAARAAIEDERAWRILEEIAVSPDAELPYSLFDESALGFSPAQRRRYGLLLLKAAGHPDLRVRKAGFAALARWPAGCEQEIAQAAAARLVDLDDGAEWHEALGALVEACRDASASQALAGAVRALVASPHRDDWDAGAERDRPARQRLQRTASLLERLPRVELGAVVGEVARALRADETLGLAAARLEVSAIDWNEVEAAAGVLERVADESGAGGWTRPLVTHLVEGFARPEVGWEPAKALALCDRLSVREEPGALLGVALLGVIGRRLSWSGELRQRLRRLRAHPSTRVRAAALEIWTCEE